MRKRLRKKLHLAEFQSLGFLVSGRLCEPIDGARIDRLLDDFIGFIESRGLVCGGGFGGPREPSVSFYVERLPRNCTDDDREAVGTWLRARPEMASVDVAALEDAWYPDGLQRRS